MKTNPNHQAFPSHGTMGEVCYEGMTKRELFAKDLTAALLSNRDLTFNYKGDNFEKDFCNSGVSFADALIQKLNEGKDEIEK